MIYAKKNGWRFSWRGFEFAIIWHRMAWRWLWLHTRTPYLSPDDGWMANVFSLVTGPLWFLMVIPTRRTDG